MFLQNRCSSPQIPFLAFGDTRALGIQKGPKMKKETTYQVNKTQKPRRPRTSLGFARRVLQSRPGPNTHRYDMFGLGPL